MAGHLVREFSFNYNSRTGFINSVTTYNSYFIPASHISNIRVQTALGWRADGRAFHFKTVATFTTNNNHSATQTSFSENFTAPGFN